MRRTAVVALVVLATFALVGCGPKSNAKGPNGGPPTTASTANTTTPTTPLPTTAVTTPAAGPTGSAVATTLDPCQLVTSAEASKLAGASFGKGRKETVGSGGNDHTCTYGYQTANVFIVQVVKADSAKTATSNFDSYRQEANGDLARAGQAQAKIDFKLSDLANLGDRATTGTLQETYAGVTISGAAIYVVKGPYFFTFSDLRRGNTLPSIAAFKTQAQVVISRLP